MIQFSSTEERIAYFLKRMEKAMPEIEKQIKVYEAAVKSGKTKNKIVTITRNV
jgi:LPS sulfotransferase NodH